MTKMKTAGFSVVDWLECIWISELPPHSKYLACYLRTFMNSKQDIAWPSYARIISETGLSRATVAKYLEVLEESQWLIRDRESRSTTTYIATLPQPVFDSFKGIKEAIKEGSSPAKLVHELNQGSLGAKPKVVRQLNTNIQGNKQENTQVGETQAEPSQHDLSAEDGFSSHTDQPKATSDTAEQVGQTEHEAAPADKPVKTLNIPFEDFWNLYNKKVGRKKSEAKWKRLTNKDRAAIMEHLPNYIRNTPDVQYRKNPETYLNNESWNDELPNMGKTGRPEFPENQGIDASIHTKQMTGLASELTLEQRKAAQERIKAMMGDSE